MLHHRLNRASTHNRGRIRAQAACVNCKERKLKCDDQVPSCVNCQRFDVACLVEDYSTKRKVPRNYLDILEAKVKLLEGLLQQRSESQTPRDIRHCDPTNDNAQSAEVHDQASDDGLEDLVSKAGILTLQAYGAEPHYLGPSSIFSFSRVIHACVRQVVPETQSDDFDSALEDINGLSIAPCPLPRREVGLALSTAYFENVHLQYPFLHEPTFRRWEQNVHEEGPEVASPTELYFVNMVYSVGALLKANTGTLAQQLYATAQLYMEHVLAHTNLESIQAILSCAMYSLRSPMGPSAWSLSALALRRCIELGYHRNAWRINLVTNVLGLEMRKRVFWCAYQIDCGSSVNLGLPLSLAIQEVDVDFPTDIDDIFITETGMQGLPRREPTEPITTMSHALHQFELRSIWARIYTSLYSNRAAPLDLDTSQSQIQSLRKELENWIASTPPEASRYGAKLCVFGSMEDYRITYNETLLILYRRQLTRGEDVSDEVVLECLQASSSICHSCKRLYVGKPINYTWGTLHILFLAGLTYLHCLWISPRIRQLTRFDSVSTTLSNCTMLLAIMAERWKGVGPYRDLIDALASRAMVMMAEQSQDGSQHLPLPAPSSNAVNPNSEDFSQWITEISNVGMPDGFESLLNGLIGDFGHDQEEFGDNLWWSTANPSGSH